MAFKVFFPLILALSLVLQLAHTISLTPKEYRQLVEARCFNQTALRVPFLLGQSRPVGLSLDYLVSLIRQIEETLPQLSSKEMIILLLKR